MNNTDVAALFEQLADLLEIDGANAFRVRAYRNAARTLDTLPEPAAAILADATRSLTDLPGIGDDLAKKVAVVVETGALPQLEELKAKFPPGVPDMLRVPGLGPKKVAALFRELHVTSLAELKQAAEQDRIAGLKGFGRKTQQSILENVDLAASAGQRFNIHEARVAAEEIVADLAASGTVGRATAAGSLRRRRETIGDLDVLVTAADSAGPMDRLAAHPAVAEVLSRGETKQRVRLKMGLELDLRVVPDDSYGAALQYFTGSKEHNIVVRRRAQERGLKVNEYGVFRDDEAVAGRTEEEVYAAVGLPWIPPELRENRGEIEAAEQGRVPVLVTLADLRGDLHMHTTATDGTATIREMAEGAKARGLDYVAITDHSKRVSMAGGLDADRLRAHWKEIERVRKEVPGIEILKGIECDILEDATLDLPDDVLAEADWVLAVLHYGLTQPQEQIMQRLLVAIRSPHVDAIGHPTGRLLGSTSTRTNPRAGAAMDFETVCRACADHGTLLEINAHWNRLDLDDLHAAQARSHGIPIVIDTDAHSVAGLDVMEYGIDQARRAGLEAKDVANTRPLPAFRKLLKGGK